MTKSKVRELRDVQDHSHGLSHKRVLIIFMALALTLFISFLDQTSVATAMPKMGEELNAVDSIPWVGTSFLIAYTAFLLVNGRLSDIFGRKGCLLLSLGLLALGDLLCGFSKSAVMLFVFRAIAGVGAGGINSLVMVIVSDITTLKDRGKYQGYLETMIALGSGLGPLIGGVFSERASWRWTFWFLVPLAACAAVVVILLLPKAKVDGSWKEKVKQIDFFGVVISMAAVLLLLIPISGGGSTYAWSSPMVISMLIIGALLAILFVFVEWKVPSIPVMPLRLFKPTATKILFTHNFLTGIIYYTDLYFLPLYFQNVRDYSPVLSGVMILPLILSFSVGSSSSGIIISKIGFTNPVIRTGYVLWTAGAGGKIAFGRDTHIAVLVVCQIIEGIGIGFAFQPVMIAILANTRKEDRAVATGLRNFIRTTGGAVGLSIGNAIVNNCVVGNLPPGLEAKDALLLADTMTVQQKEMVVDNYMRGLKIIFTLGAPLMGYCLLSTLLLKDVDLKELARMQAEAAKVEKKGREGDLESGEKVGASACPESTSSTPPPQLEEGQSEEDLEAGVRVEDEKEVDATQAESSPSPTPPQLETKPEKSID